MTSKWIGPGNWVADNQNAPQPPPYFLQRIYDYDAMLVVMPSRDNPGAYVIARRKQFGPGVTPAAIDAVYTKADTKMCILHNTVPVCLMMQTGTSWDPEQIIEKLFHRDIWRHGGADKVADMLEEQEAAAQAKIDADIRDDLYNRSGDAWRSYQARTGQSNIQFNGRHERPVDSPPNGEVAAPHTTAGARSTAGLGQLSGCSSTASGLSAGAEPKG
jgi:hypothetical protein